MRVRRPRLAGLIQPAAPAADINLVLTRHEIGIIFAALALAAVTVGIVFAVFPLPPA